MSHNKDINKIKRANKTRKDNILRTGIEPNANKEKIEKAKQTRKINRDKKVLSELELFESISLEELMKYNIVFNTYTKTPKFIKTFKLVYHKIHTLMKQRLTNSLNPTNKELNESIYLFYNQRNDCELCGCETDFISVSKGYKRFCDVKCTNIWISKNKDLEKWRTSFQTTISNRDSEHFSNKAKETYNRNLKNGVEEKRINKIRATKIKNGLWVENKYKKDYIHYKILVEYFTKKNYKENFNLINPKNVNRTRADIDENAYHLDHIISKKYGFEKGILPSIIGSVKNLQMLPYKENCSKQHYIDDKLLNDIVYS